MLKVENAKKHIHEYDVAAVCVLMSECEAGLSWGEAEDWIPLPTSPQ